MFSNKKKSVRICVISVIRVLFPICYFRIFHAIIILDKQLKFLYASELKQIYDVYGHFYDLKIGTTVFKCRSILEIVKKRIAFNANMPVDSVVVMMNPGSSKPLDPEYVPTLFTMQEMSGRDWKKEIVPTRPDNAQYQIMRLMEFKNWQYVRVLNLSDLRNGNSGKFYDDFIRASKIDASNPHSIFHLARKKEFKKCLNLKSGAPVILGWGNESFLIPLAQSALNSLKECKLAGVSKNDNPFYYSYPSPYLKDQKLFWLNTIIKILK